MDIYKSVYEKVMDIVGLPFNIYDAEGKCIVGSSEGTSIPIANFEDFFEYDNFFVINNWIYKSVRMNGKFLCCIAMKGLSPEVQKYIGLIEQMIIGFNKTDTNRLSIFRNIIEGRDINIEKAAEKTEVPVIKDRMVILVKMNSSFEEVREILKQMFPDEASEILIDIDTDKVLLIKSVEENGDSPQKVAMSILDTLIAELYEKVKVAIGGISKSLYDLRKIYKRAETAMVLGEIFEDKNKILDYEQLGLKRLISQIPIEIEKAYLNEIFKNKKDFLEDKELYDTALKFFESNLNISEASRNLYIHRNTLVYRLDKIQRLLGLDLRDFDDAVILKIALMFDEYIKFMEKYALTDT
ncbi:carbohydrate diacid regulator [Caldanaerobius fijiensis DSM 17918]|uniref:Carbohydrate diacid regulator n=1 Tax=Caldanaerobius fijiensis DSM 17918 TaxID=1121256 RepID=A0A1M5DEP1_9THEO|nr:PucR family transcriptional regulator [Caldanaerobius fijiensis]SHF65304.1 carbohydrate diacid regulator [Caldanaerobius fijiensis DSM 17918]